MKLEATEEMWIALRELQELLEKHGATLGYTNNDDGVHLTLESGEDVKFWDTPKELLE